MDGRTDGQNYKHKLHVGCRNWCWPSNSSKRGTKQVFRVNLSQIHPAVPKISAKNSVFCCWWPWPMTFDLDIQTCPSKGSNCKFGTNPFSGSRDISYINQKVTDSVKNRILCSYLRITDSLMYWLGIENRLRLTFAYWACTYRYAQFPRSLQQKL